MIMLLFANVVYVMTNSCFYLPDDFQERFEKADRYQEIT